MALTLDQLRYHRFGTSDAFCKTLLCILAYHQPKSFGTNAIVNLDNSWLKQSNSKNYHHSFPKAYLEKKGVEYWKANSIVNIAIVDNSLNKKEIRAKAPSVYMKVFAKRNDELESTMKTHLIGGLDAFGITDDNYQRRESDSCRSFFSPKIVCDVTRQETERLIGTARSR